MICEQNLIKIPVHNVSEASNFYRDVLGFELVFVTEKYGWAQLESKDISLAVYNPSKDGGRRVIGCEIDLEMKLPPKEFKNLVRRVRHNHNLSDGIIHQSKRGTPFLQVFDPDHHIIKVFSTIKQNYDQ